MCERFSRTAGRAQRAQWARPDAEGRNPPRLKPCAARTHGSESGCEVQQAYLVRAQSHARDLDERTRNAQIARRCNYVLQPYILSQTHRCRIDRSGKRVGKRHGPILPTAEILRFPSVDAYRSRVNQVRWRVAVAQRSQVDKHLEYRTRLASGIDGTVELAVVVVATADHC